ncbi:MAG: VCBS domain-containing protein, partial [Rhodospirillales bacterium]|nr:VCBS domain-containing protein [Rhodospirillales bacterium]
MVIDASGGGRIVVPEHVFLHKAGFERQGADLQLTQGDRSLLLKGYFGQGGTPGDLVMEGSGAIVTGQTAKILAGSPAFVQLAQAGGVAAGPAAIGKVTALTGDVQVIRGGVVLSSTGGAEKVGIDTPIYRNDILVTGKASSVGVTFVDKTNFALGADARMTMNEFAYNPQNGTGQALLSVLQGSFSFVSGQVAKTGPDAIKVQLPTMTIGIRGTTVAGQASAEGAESQVTLLKNADGTVGAIFVHNAQAGFLINQANFTLYSSSQSQPMQQPSLLVNLTKYQDAISTLQKAIQSGGPGEKAGLDGKSPADLALARALAEVNTASGGDGASGGGGFSTQTFADLGVTLVVFQSGGELFAAVFNNANSDFEKSGGGGFGGQQQTNNVETAVEPPPAPIVVGTTSIDTDEDSPGEGNVPPPSEAPGPVVFSLLVPPILGSVVLQPDGSYVYTPGSVLQSLAEGQTATDAFTVVITDANGVVTQQIINVNITGENDAPVAANDPVLAVEDGGATAGNVLDNDGDVDSGAQLQVSAVNGSSENLGQAIDGQYGTFVLNADGTYSYTPDAESQEINALAQGQQLSETFSYSIVDEFGATSEATVTVTVIGTNDAPEAVATSAAVMEDVQTSTAGNVIEGYTYDPDNGADLRIISVNGIALGSGGEGGGGRELTETAQGYLSGQGNSLVNGLGGTSGFGESVVPVGDDNSTGAVDITSVFGAGGINFFGQTYTSLFVNNNGNITFSQSLSTYTPDQIAGGFGVPIIAAFWADVDTEGGDTGATPGGTSTGTNNVYYDLDVPNGVLTITWDDVGYYDDGTELANAFQMQLIDRGNGDFDIVFRYESINWTTGDASDGEGGLGGTPARAGYTAGNGEDYYELPGSGNQNAMLGLDQATGNTGEVGVFVFQVRNGEVVGGSGSVEIESQYGILTMHADGSYSYALKNESAAVQKLALGETHDDVFTYVIADEFGAPVEQTLTITVTGVNDAPVADNDFNAAAEDGGDQVVEGNVLANDSDVDNGAALFVASASAVGGEGGGGGPVFAIGSGEPQAIYGQYGTLYLAANGSYDYVVYEDSQSLAELGEGEQGQDQFTYTVSDGQGGFDTAVLTITVTGSNQDPLAEGNRSAVVSEDAGAVALMIAAPSDGDANDVLTALVTGLPSNGTIKLADGTLVQDGAVLSVDDLTGLTFTPDPEAGNATSAFTYVVQDGQGGSDAASVSITTVEATNQVVVGYYDMVDGEGDPLQADSIQAVGYEAISIDDPSASALEGLDVLFVQNPLNAGYGAEYLSRLGDIAAAVAAGMTLVIHDRHVATAESILPGGESFDIVRDFDQGDDIDVLAPDSVLADGPGGVIDNLTLDGGTFSSHGFAFAGSLPEGTELLLSTGDPEHIVAFLYSYGEGHIFYSSVPLDFYLGTAGNDAYNDAFVNTYAPNVAAYAGSFSGALTGAEFAGGPGNDVLVGGSGGDLLVGHGGQDVILAG